MTDDCLKFFLYLIKFFTSMIILIQWYGMKFEIRTAYERPSRMCSNNWPTMDINSDANSRMKMLCASLKIQHVISWLSAAKSWSIKNSLFAVYSIDSRFFTDAGWYRFPNATISNYCVKTFSCGTYSTLWINSTGDNFSLVSSRSTLKFENSVLNIITTISQADFLLSIYRPKNEEPRTSIRAAASLKLKHHQGITYFNCLIIIYCFSIIDIYFIYQVHSSH